MIKCCVVSIVEDVPVVDVITGLVGGIKIDDDTDYPESECFRNMSAVGASMAMEVLTQGILVNQATMYGVIIELDKPNETRLLKLTCDFPMGTSHNYIIQYNNIHDEIHYEYYILLAKITNWNTLSMNNFRA